MSKTKKPSAPIESPVNQVTAKLQKDQQATTNQYAGAIPPPEILLGIEQIVPGSAERILKMAEDNNKHQIEIESAALKYASSEKKRGQIFGFVLSILAFSTCIMALLLGSEATAITISSVTIVGLVTVFVIGHLRK